MRTDKWIADTLWNLMQQGYVDIRSLFYAFTAYAEEAYRKMRVPLTYQGTKFCFAGFINRSRALAFEATASNMIFSERGNYKVKREFHTDINSFRPDVPDFESSVHIHGTVQAFLSNDAIAKSALRQTRRIHDQIKKVEREGATQDEGWVARHLVQIIRMASHHPVYGRYINRDCMTVNMAAYSNDVGCFYYSGDKDSFMHYFPIMVNQGMVFTGEFELRPEAPEEIQRSRTKGDDKQ
jgi:hypothetical protein